MHTDSSRILWPFFLFTPSFPHTIPKNIQTKLHPHHLLQIFGPMWVWVVFPSHTIWLPSLSLLMPTKTWYTAHSNKCTGYFSTKHHSAKKEQGLLWELKEKWHLHGFLQITFTAPPACSKSPLLPPGQKKEKPQKLIKTKKKPFRSYSFEHILAFLSKTHHSTINHKSP